MHSSKKEKQNKKQGRVCVLYGALRIPVTATYQDGQMLKTQKSRISRTSEFVVLVREKYVGIRSLATSCPTFWKWPWENQNALKVKGMVPCCLMEMASFCVSRLYVVLFEFTIVLMFVMF